MNVNEYLSHFIDSLNQNYFEALAGLSDAQLHFRPNDETMCAGWHAWHFFRTEDNIVNFVLQGRKPPVWLRGNLHEAWDLPKVAQGTGMPREEAQALRFPGADALIQYGRDVLADIGPYVAAAGDEELQSVSRVAGWGERPKIQHIGQTVIAHGNAHHGQILVMRALQGLPGDTT